MLLTSYSHTQLALGPLSVAAAPVWPCGCVPLALGKAGVLPWFSRSHIKTNESSPPEARVPRLDGDHSMQLMGALWPRKSSRA